MRECDISRAIFKGVNRTYLQRVARRIGLICLQTVMQLLKSTYGFSIALDGSRLLLNDLDFNQQVLPGCPSTALNFFSFLSLKRTFLRVTLLSLKGPPPKNTLSMF